MLSVKAGEAADAIFKVFGMAQLRIKPSLPASQVNATISLTPLTAQGYEQIPTFALLTDNCNF